MIKEALQYIQGLKEAAPYRELIHGVEWTDRTLKIIQPPSPEPLKLESLSGFIDFVARAGSLEGFDNLNTYIVVENFDAVSLHLQPGKEGSRRLVASCRPPKVSGYIVDQPMSTEKFIVALKTHAQKSTVVDSLIESISHISLENIATLKDNGVFQEVAVKSGINVIAWKTPAFFPLELRRTFKEAGGTESEFFLRLRQASENSVSITLHESTFDQWREDTMAKVRSLVKSSLPEWIVI